MTDQTPNAETEPTPTMPVKRKRTAGRKPRTRTLKDLQAEAEAEEQAKQAAYAAWLAEAQQGQRKPVDVQVANVQARTNLMAQADANDAAYAALQAQQQALILAQQQQQQALIPAHALPPHATPGLPAVPPGFTPELMAQWAAFMAQAGGAPSAPHTAPARAELRGASAPAKAPKAPKPIKAPEGGTLEQRPYGTVVLAEWGPSFALHTGSEGGGRPFKLGLSKVRAVLANVKALEAFVAEYGDWSKVPSAPKARGKAGKLSDRERADALENTLSKLGPLLAQLGVKL